MTNHVMKVFCLILPVAMALGDEIDVNEIKFVPFSVEIIGSDAGFKEDGIIVTLEDGSEKKLITNRTNKGIELGVKLLFPEAEGVKVSLPWGGQNEDNPLVLKDFKGKDLGKGRFSTDKHTEAIYSFGFHREISKKEHEYYYGSGNRYKFIFRKFPSPGATWLHLTGSYTAQIDYQKTPTDPVVLQLKKGVEAKTGNFTIKILTVESCEEMKKREQEEKEQEEKKDHKQKQENKEIPTYFISNSFLGFGDFNYCFCFKLEADSEEYDADDLILTDSEGNTLKYSTNMDFKGGSNMYKCGLVDLPPEINVSVKYRRVQKVDVPMDLKFNLTGKDV